MTDHFALLQHDSHPSACHRRRECVTRERHIERVERRTSFFEARFCTLNLLNAGAVFGFAQAVIQSVALLKRALQLGLEIFLLRHRNSTVRHERLRARKMRLDECDARICRVQLVREREDFFVACPRAKKCKLCLSGFDFREAHVAHRELKRVVELADERCRLHIDAAIHSEACNATWHFKANVALVELNDALKLFHFFRFWFGEGRTPRNQTQSCEQKEVLYHSYDNGLALCDDKREMITFAIFMAMSTDASAAAPTTTDIQSFAEFWPFYLGEHRNPTSRVLHYFGTSCAVLTLLGAIFVNAKLGFLVPVAGYGPAWIGHFLIEKNRPATFKYPGWSIMGDFKMITYALTGKINAELAKLPPK